MRLHLYLRKGKVIIPTSGAVHQRLHRDIEPVAVADVSDAEGIRQAIHATIARGNPPTPYYKPGIHPQPVVVKYAGVRSWSAFARGTSTWDINKRGANYRIVGRSLGRDGWIEDPNKTIDFPPGTSVDTVIDRMIAILQDATRRPQGD
jgi:hypothetical protein